MFRMAALAVAVAGLCLPAAWAAPAAHTYFGPVVGIGGGTARIVVEADAANRPTAFGVEMTAGALQLLPQREDPNNPALDWHSYLWFPTDGPTTGFDHLLIDWHPHGHVPPGIYTFPHFDFHFYLISQQAQKAIKFPHPETPDMAGVTMPAKDLIAPGYFIPPGTQVNEMGVHAVAKAAPEFHGKRFTYTLIYGYDKGDLAFIEPMVTTAYLATKPNVSAAIPEPAQVSYPAYYPGRYSVTYNPAKQAYVVMLEQLRLRHPSTMASAK